MGVYHLCYLSVAGQTIDWSRFSPLDIDCMLFELAVLHSDKMHRMDEAQA